MREEGKGSGAYAEFSCISYDYIYTVKMTQMYITHTHTYTAGFDYVPTTTELTFQPGTTSVCGSVGQVKDDIIVEGAESFSLLLSSQNNRVLIPQNTAQVTIEDNDGMCNSCLTQTFWEGRRKDACGRGISCVCAEM